MGREVELPEAFMRLSPYTIDTDEWVMETPYGPMKHVSGKTYQQLLSDGEESRKTITNKPRRDDDAILLGTTWQKHLQTLS